MLTPSFLLSSDTELVYIMATWLDALGEFDAAAAAYPGIQSFSDAQDAVNIVAAQMLRLRGSIGMGFTKLDGIVDQLNNFGTKLDLEITDLRAIVNIVNQANNGINNKIDKENSSI